MTSTPAQDPGYDTPDCPKARDGGSHSIAWHQGGTCAFCRQPAPAR
jgi:hypothetical protein